MENLMINIGLFGSVSVGKTTLLNAIISQQISDTEIKKTTMIPQIYTKSDFQPFSTYVIRHNNKSVNEHVTNLIENNKFTINDCQPIYHLVEMYDNLFDEIGECGIESTFKINIYDIPGLNDSSSKDVYFEWVKQNIHIFDIIIFMTDITKGLNTSDEVDILKLLMSNMGPNSESSKPKNYPFMICIMNKCDNIYYDHDQSDLFFQDDEHVNIYLQANNILSDLASKYNISDRVTAFLPLAAENCFIYRILKNNPNSILDQHYQNVLCRNECGINKYKKMSNEEKKDLLEKIIDEVNRTYSSKIMDTGYYSLKLIIQDILLKNKINFVNHHLIYNLGDLIQTNIVEVDQYISKIEKFLSTFEEIKKIIGEISYEKLWENIILTVRNFVNNIYKINTTIITNNKYTVTDAEFETVHNKLVDSCLQLHSLQEFLLTVPEYPSEIIHKLKLQAAIPLLRIYDQLIIIENKDNMHILPYNLNLYLQHINMYAPLYFDTYALKFIGFCTHQKNISVNEKDMGDMILYISNHLSSNSTSNSTFIKNLVTILTNRQLNFSTENFPLYFQYLLFTKNMIVKSIKECSIQNNYHLFVLYEITDKNILLSLDKTCPINVFHREIDKNKIQTLLSDETNYNDRFQFENKLFTSINILNHKLNHKLNYNSSYKEQYQLDITKAQTVSNVTYPVITNLTSVVNV